MEFSFFFPTKNRGGSYLMGCLMQGLHQLGHKVYTNISLNEFVSNGPFPPFSNLHHEKIEVTKDMSRGNLIVDAFDGLGNFANDLVKSAEKNKITLINMNDACNFRDYPENFLVFSTHFNKFALRKGQIFPMSFGVSQEAILFSEQYEMKNRHNGILRNFRPSFEQSLRNCLDLVLLPKLKKYFQINEDITNHQQYLEHLYSYKAVLSYGGSIYKDLRLNPFFRGQKDFEFMELNRDPVILRFDSWRLYEAALFGACPISLDFDKYGLDCAANPVPWKEYIPLDLEAIDATVERMISGSRSDPMFFEKIGANARSWVLKNHSPVANVQRMLGVMKKKNFL